MPQQSPYAGYWYDNELGWYWLSVRDYDPMLERFLQPDPSQQEGLFSYAYVGDDPVDATDPDGTAGMPPASMPQSVIDQLIQAVKRRFPRSRACRSMGAGWATCAAICRHRGPSGDSQLL